MNRFIVFFEFIDESVFQTINNLKYNLDIVFKGRYKLEVTFNKSDVVKQHHLRGAPALINVKTGQVIYGSFENKSFLKVLFKHAS
ncbi:MAG: hypothetical protein HQM16_04945 [Deltaproteobacteria bacterium]|nr:hypothetical protein [Deltaproteobacteria bacterium]